MKLKIGSWVDAKNVKNILKKNRFLGDWRFTEDICVRGYSGDLYEHVLYIYKGDNIIVEGVASFKKRVQELTSVDDWSPLLDLREKVNK